MTNVSGENLPSGMPREVKTVGGFEFVTFYPTEDDVTTAAAFVMEQCDPTTVGQEDRHHNTVKLALAAGGDRTIDDGKEDIRSREVTLVDGRKVLVTGKGHGEGTVYSYALVTTDEHPVSDS